MKKTHRVGRRSKMEDRGWRDSRSSILNPRSCELNRAPAHIGAESSQPNWRHALLARSFLEQLMPSFQSFFILSDRPASFRVPALEPVVFLSAAEVQVFEQFLSFGAQEK